MIGYISWFFVHCLMLTIFVKYGKPMEDDEKTLIENKLLEMCQQAQEQDENEELRQERKFKAYREMADLQVKEIIRTMRAYTSQSDQIRTASTSSSASTLSGKTESFDSSLPLQANDFLTIIDD